VDSPGLNDPGMTTAAWADRLSKIIVGDRAVSLCLMVIKTKWRPDICDKQNILVMAEAIKKIEADNYAVVMTHTD